MKKLLLITLFLFSAQAFAMTIKVGVLAPEGTSWSKNLKKMAKEIKKATDGKVKFRIYFGGSQGDEHDVLRKIRIGQLHGGIFTGKTLGDINGDVRTMEIPFTFIDDTKKAWSTLQTMAPFFNKKFESAGFSNLGFFEIGNVYFVSQKQTPNLESLKGIKIWAWEGDKLVNTFLSIMDLVAVPLPLPDVLSSLSTGIIEAAYAPPNGIIALQWNTKVKYLVDFPISYSVGAFLVSNKRWKKVSDKHKKIVAEISSKYIGKVNKSVAKDNKDALAVMKASGIQFINFPEKDIKQGKQIREKIIKKLKGDLFSEEALKKLESNL